MSIFTFLSVAAYPKEFGALNGRQFHVYVNGELAPKCKRVLVLFGLGLAWFVDGDADNPLAEKWKARFGRIRLEQFFEIQAAPEGRPIPYIEEYEDGSAKLIRGDESEWVKRPAEEAEKMDSQEPKPWEGPRHKVVFINVGKQVPIDVIDGLKKHLDDQLSKLGVKAVLLGPGLALDSPSNERLDELGAKIDAMAKAQNDLADAVRHCAESTLKMIQELTRDHAG